ncbi:hypothetical protein D3C75_1176510 [compost metagenome]
MGLLTLHEQFVTTRAEKPGPASATRFLVLRIRVAAGPATVDNFEAPFHAGSESSA